MRQEIINSTTGFPSEAISVGAEGTQVSFNLHRLQKKSKSRGGFLDPVPVLSLAPIHKTPNEFCWQNKSSLANETRFKLQGEGCERQLSTRIEGTQKLCSLWHERTDLAKIYQKWCGEHWSWLGKGGHLSPRVLTIITSHFHWQLKVLFFQENLTTWLWGQRVGMPSQNLVVPLPLSQNTINTLLPALCVQHPVSHLKRPSF